MILAKPNFTPGKAIGKGICISITNNDKAIPVNKANLVNFDTVTLSPTLQSYLLFFHLQKKLKDD